MRERDNRHHFIIETCDVRGQLVRLDACWAEARARTDYPANVQTILGEAFAATALLAGTIKFDGKLTLQVRGSGDIHLLVVQITNDGQLRGLARWSDEPATTHSLDAFGEDARMTIVIEANQYSEPYQGIVPLEGDSLADAITSYFANSEQLDTKLYFAVSDECAAGLLLQALPAGEARHTEDDDGWERAITLADTLSDEEFRSVDAGTLLYRLYHEEQVRLFEPAALAFSCSCSRGRTDGMLTGLGQAEVVDIIEEQGSVEITCEFCDAVYRYDSIDIAALFATGSVEGVDTRH